MRECFALDDLHPSNVSGKDVLHKLLRPPGGGGGGGAGHFPGKLKN